MASLSFPSTDVRCEFMDEDDRIAVTTLLELKPRSGGIDIWHRVFSHPQLTRPGLETEQSSEMQSIRPDDRGIA